MNENIAAALIAQLVHPSWHEDSHTEVLRVLLTHEPFLRVFLHETLGVPVPDEDIPALRVDTQVKNRCGQGESDIEITGVNVQITIEVKVRSFFNPTQPQKYFDKVREWGRPRTGGFAVLGVLGLESHLDRLASCTWQRLPASTAVEAGRSRTIEGVDVRVISWQQVVAALLTAPTTDPIARHMLVSLNILLGETHKQTLLSLTSETIQMIENSTFASASTQVQDVLAATYEELQRREARLKIEELKIHFRWQGFYAGANDDSDSERIFVANFPRAGHLFRRGPIWVQFGYGEAARVALAALGYEPESLTGVDDDWGGHGIAVSLEEGHPSEQALRIVDLINEIRRAGGRSEFKRPA